MKKLSKYAWWISRIFEPPMVAGITIVLAMYWGWINNLPWRFFLALGFFDIFLPFVYFLVSLAKRKVSNWEWSVRQERLPIYVFTALCHFLGILAASWFGKLEIMRLLISLYVLFLVFLTIITRYKISTHTGVLSSLIFILVVFFGPWFWLGYLLVALVGWSRVSLKTHQVSEVFWGAVLPPMVLSLAFRFWGQPVFCGSC
ncbi:hypothetical protein KKD62_00925 [Patescibacteria group bacterium]|nr:hypothetical protein [Patescibacteria group bacterium]MBU1931150.1 hypothetical protein [Patescibacteria group bacterium]